MGTYTIIIETKRCGRCKTDKPADAFWSGQRWCKPCFREANTDWQRKNPEKRRAIKVRNYVAIRVSQRAWRRANPDKVRLKRRESEGLRRAKKRGNFVERVYFRKVAERDNWTCGICKLPVVGEDVTLDHILAIANGGAHSYANIQLAHMVCNSRKGDR